VDDGDAAAAGEERALVPVPPTDAVVDAFAGTLDFEDLALTCRVPCPLRLQYHPISNSARYHRSTSPETSIEIKSISRKDGAFAAAELTV